ncbi:MAG: tryptophan--tRNA ligase [Candidatus Firestonebacteria bacterium]
MRPTGKLHIGNLLGALNNWVKLQDSYKCYYMVADWHALTSEYANSKEIPTNIKEMVVDWLSAGIDPEKSTIFVQSNVTQHSELHLLLSMITPISWLERCPTYKEQTKEIKDRDLSNYGFLGYPVLQAADILIYKAEVVPIGQDQLPHLELTREICRRFNNLYGQVFPEPVHLFTEIPKVLGTDGRKMSKSYNNCIYISDSKEEIKKKIKLCYTDPGKIHLGDAGHPNECPVFLLHHMYSQNEKGNIKTDCPSGKLGCADCKNMLIKNITSGLEEIHQKRNLIISKKGYINDVLEHGLKKAKEVAEKTMEEVRKAVFGIK